MKRRTYLLAAASTVALVGCAGTPPSSGGDDSATASTTTTAPEAVVQYRTLSDEGRDVFEALLETDSLVGTESDFPDDVWAADYVDYEGTVYAIERSRTGNYRSKFVLSTEFVDEGDVEDDADVVAYEELDPAARDAFEKARTDGEYRSRGEPPSQLVQHRYVGYEGDYYRLDRVVADVPTWELSAAKAEGDTTAESGESEA